MHSEADVTRLVRSWLRTDDHESAGQVLDDVLARLDATPQLQSISPAGRIADLSVAAKLAIAAAAVAIAAVVGINVVSNGDGVGTSGVVTSPSPSPTLRLRPSPAPGDVEPDAGLFVIGRNSMTIDGIRFSLDVPSGWEFHGPDYSNYISKSTAGPQGAEAVISGRAIPPAADRRVPAITSGAGPSGPRLPISRPLCRRYPAPRSSPDLRT